MAPGGTGALIAMRSEIASSLRGEPELKLLDADLRHLFTSWFNRGFLELRRIDWQTPAAVLEKLIAYEAVHEIKGWDDLRRRLAPVRYSPASHSTSVSKVKVCADRLRSPRVTSKSNLG
jgi:malonyl-CoA decarboxylase